MSGEGWTAIKRGSHWTVTMPDGRTIVGIAATIPGKGTRTEAEVIALAKVIAVKRGYTKEA